MPGSLGCSSFARSERRATSERQREYWRPRPPPAVHDDRPSGFELGAGVRGELSRAVAVAIVRYRAEHDLSQRELAERLRMKQPQVARLELGEVNPNIDTLMRISAALGIELTIDVLPAGAPARNVTKRARANNVVGSVRTDEAELVVLAR